MTTISTSEQDELAKMLRETLHKSGLRPGEAIAVLLTAVQTIVRDEVYPQIFADGRCDRTRAQIGCHAPGAA